MILNCVVFKLSTIDWTAISAIASTLMIIITGISIICSNKQNKETRKENDNQNSQNRELQVRAIEYQAHLNWVMNLQKAIINMADNLRFDIVDSFRDNDPSHNDRILSDAFKRVNAAKSSLASFLIGRNYEEEKRFIQFLSVFITKYFDFLFDLRFLHSVSSGTLTEELRDNVEQYKSSKQKYSNGTNRIWNIITFHGIIVTNADLSNYLNTLIKEYHFEEFENSYLNLIEFENSLAKHILYGTERRN